MIEKALGSTENFRHDSSMACLLRHKLRVSTSVRSEEPALEVE